MLKPTPNCRHTTSMKRTRFCKAYEGVTLHLLDQDTNHYTCNALQSSVITLPVFQFISNATPPISRPCLLHRALPVPVPP